MNCKSRRLSILLVSRFNLSANKIIKIGKTTPSYNDVEFIDYVELLSASNYCFDILRPEQITRDTFVHNHIIKYVVVIMTEPMSTIPDSVVSVIKEVSCNYGISLISNFTNVDMRSKSLFGIRKLKGRCLLWPLKIKINRWPNKSHENQIVVDYGLSAGFAGIRKRNFKKLSIMKTFIKLLNVIRSQILPYANVDLDPKAAILSTNMNGRPLVWSFKYGNAINYYFALHGDLFLDKYNEMHKLVRAVIDSNSDLGMASVDLENSVVLRLDDPGSCLKDYLGTSVVLGEEDWDKIGKFLEKKKLPMSVMYTPGWVDDGDYKAGQLYIDDQEILDRSTGEIYNSSQVRYVSANETNKEYDHKAEFRGLKKLMSNGVVDIHSHGLTHLNPDYESWSSANDKNNNSQWYHEFYNVKKKKKVNQDYQIVAMSSSKEKIQDIFGVIPYAITPSGHQHDSNCDILAHNAGYKLFSADFTSILKENNIIRNWKIPSIFLYLKDATPFATLSGYPFIGVIHDYEIKEGIGNFKLVLEKWFANGLNRFISMREFAVSLCSSIHANINEENSKINIQINLPGNEENNEGYEMVDGVNLLLKINIPSGCYINKELTLISGATLISLKQLNSENVLRLLIEIRKPFNININLSMQYVDA